MHTNLTPDFENDGRNSTVKIKPLNREINQEKLEQKSPSKIALADDVNWAERNEYWLKKTPIKSQRFLKRAGVRQVLILSGHGVHLRVDHGSLLVRNGFTHYPQQQETWQFFPGDWRLPSRIVLLDVDGSISFHALSWLSIHEIPLVQINWRGEVTNIIGTSFRVTDSVLTKNQLAARTNGWGLRFARQLILDKTKNSIETLRLALPKSDDVNWAIKKLRKSFSHLKRRVPADYSRLMGTEGLVGSVYFKAWRSCSINWKGIDQYQIPEDWHRIGPRTSKVGDKHQRNYRATHPVNSILNYGYAVLENQIRMQIVARGFDPTIGYLHGQRHGKHGLVLDLMEPMRPIVDRKVLKFVQRQTFAPGDFTLLNNGVCRLNPQLARNVVRAIDVSEDIEISVGRFVAALNPR
jgi:CRISPR-associated endonuclease Cas1